jgi:hypothetical protein
MSDPKLAHVGSRNKIHTPAISDCGASALEARATLGLARRPTPSSAVHKVTTPTAGAASRAVGVRSNSSSCEWHRASTLASRATPMRPARL